MQRLFRELRHEGELHHEDMVVKEKEELEIISYYMIEDYKMKKMPAYGKHIGDTLGGRLRV